MTEKSKRGKDGELICFPGDHSVSEAGETAMSYDLITPADKKQGISDSTCLRCRKEIRKKAQVQTQS